MPANGIEPLSKAYESFVLPLNYAGQLFLNYTLNWGNMEENAAWRMIVVSKVNHSIIQFKYVIVKECTLTFYGSSVIIVFAW